MGVVGAVAYILQRYALRIGNQVDVAGVESWRRQGVIRTQFPQFILASGAQTSTHILSTALGGDDMHFGGQPRRVSLQRQRVTGFGHNLRGIGSDREQDAAWVRMGQSRVGLVHRGSISGNGEKIPPTPLLQRGA